MKFAPFLSVMALIACNAVSAQQVTDFRQPGDVIRLEVKFDGSDAAKIQKVIASLERTSPALDDQVNFHANISTGWTSETSPHTFDVEIKIPDDIGTGEYRLTIIALSPYGQTNYVAGQQFQLATFHIRNPAKFTPPGIQVTVLKANQ